MHRSQGICMGLPAACDDRPMGRGVRYPASAPSENRPLLRSSNFEAAGSVEMQGLQASTGSRLCWQERAMAGCIFESDSEEASSSAAFMTAQSCLARACWICHRLSSIKAGTNLQASCTPARPNLQAELDFMIVRGWTTDETSPPRRNVTSQKI